MKLLEDVTKSWLREGSLPVPPGVVAGSGETAFRAAEGLGGRVVVKALVAAGRRGKAGAVRICPDPHSAATAAQDILRLSVADQTVEQVYIERTVDIDEELYLSFAFGDRKPLLLVSCRGGVEIEQTFATDDQAVQSIEIDPERGLTPWNARAIWDRAGAHSKFIPALGDLTVQLYEAFRAGDMLVLEINPLALTSSGDFVVVGAMAEVDDQALYRQPRWNALAAYGAHGNRLTPGEAKVKAANETWSGGAVRYTELDGDIGLMVAGGGAGLLQHDMIVAAGGRPANHSDVSPSPTFDKPAAIFDAIFSHPKVRGLLIGYNHLQMARCDLVIEGLLVSIERNNVDTRRFPIVIRLFGPGEEAARALAAQLPGLNYLPSSASLEEGCRAIVAAVRQQPVKDTAP